jgi:hypothetical protein
MRGGRETATPNGAATVLTERFIEIYYTALQTNSYREGLKASSCHLV